MVDYMLDDRTIDARAELRQSRKHANEDRYMPPLLDAIRACRASGDTAFRGALKHWLDSLTARGLDLRSERRLMLPTVLRDALGLASQKVILEEGSLWVACDGTKAFLLYSPS